MEATWEEVRSTADEVVGADLNLEIAAPGIDDNTDVQDLKADPNIRVDADVDADASADTHVGVDGEESVASQADSTADADNDSQANAAADANVDVQLRTQANLCGKSGS